MSRDRRRPPDSFERFLEILHDTDAERAVARRLWSAAAERLQEAFNAQQERVLEAMAQGEESIIHPAHRCLRIEIDGFTEEDLEVLDGSAEAMAGLFAEPEEGGEP